MFPEAVVIDAANQKEENVTNIDSMKVFHAAATEDISDPIFTRYKKEISINKKVKLSQPAAVDLMKELKLYEATGCRTRHLDCLYQLSVFTDN